MTDLTDLSSSGTDKEPAWNLTTLGGQNTIETASRYDNMHY